MRRMVIIAFIVVSFLVVFYGILTLPPTIPIHFDMNGNPDSYGSKFTLLILPIVALLTYLGVPIIFKIDPYAKKIEPRKFVLLAIRDILVIFFSVVSIVAVLGAQRGYLFPNLMAALVSALLMVIGNYMPRLPHNWFVGIRTPWTLVSEHVWRRTHRVFGVAFFLLGLLMLVFSFISIEIWLWIMISGIILITIGAFLYSYLIYRQEVKANS